MTTATLRSSMEAAATDLLQRHPEYGPLRTCIVCLHTMLGDGSVHPNCRPETPSLATARAAGRQGQAAVEAATDAEWLARAEAWIAELDAGATFMAEDVVIALREQGWEADNAKAIGPVMQRLARAGTIERTGETRAARTSHGSDKPEWRRTATSATSRWDLRPGEELFA